MITHNRPTDYHYHYHDLAQYDGGLVAIPDNYFEHTFALVIIGDDNLGCSGRQPKTSQTSTGSKQPGSLTFALVGNVRYVTLVLESMYKLWSKL